MPHPASPGRGLLTARPEPPVDGGRPGLHVLGLGGRRDGLLYVPERYRPDRPAPLALLYHGAGADGRQALGYFHGAADSAGLLVLAPDSRGRTWDVVLGGLGPDVAFVEEALDQTFRRYAVDTGRLIVGGFSDGASYALTIGLVNGDLFSHVIAFSPGFMAPTTPHGRPRVFVSHGTADPVLPIDRCSRRIVPDLRRNRYDVTYREFEGGHVIPRDIAYAAARWVLDE